MTAMFEIGDTVVHDRYGAGTVVGSKHITLNGAERTYICIQLAGERGTLMVQPDEIKEDEIRRALDDFGVIREVFQMMPEELADQHRSRQPRLQAKLRSNDPRLIAEVLRDLTWREQTGGLTETDKRIREKARRKLLRELKLSDQIASATDLLDELISSSMEKHLSKYMAGV